MLEGHVRPAQRCDLASPHPRSQEQPPHRELAIVGDVPQEPAYFLCRPGPHLEQGLAGSVNRSCWVALECRRALRLN